MSDNLSRSEPARRPGQTPGAKRVELSEERIEQIGLEIDRLFKDLGKQPASEQLARYCQILELGRERGWVYSTDPERESGRIRCINARMNELSQEIQNREPRRGRPQKDGK
jgi:hypothetical protein